MGNMMHSSVLFALLSLVCAGVNDVVFKRYARKVRSRGMYIFGIGMVWTLMQVLTLNFKGVPLVLDSTTLGFGLLAGLFLTGSNILLLECLTIIDVSLGSTIYRLNTIGVVGLSFLLLNEPLGLMKCLGILVGVIGVLLLYQKSAGGGRSPTFLLFLGLAVAASSLRASYGVISKAGLLQLADAQTMLLCIGASWIVGGAGYAILRERQFVFTGKKAAYSVVSGILVFLIVNFLMEAMERGQASIVIPIANVSFVVAVVLSALLRMERLTFKKGMAIVCAAGSIVLLSSS